MSTKKDNALALESRVQQALAFGRAQERPVWTDIAKEFDVKVRTLYLRQKGVRSRFDRTPVNKKLNDAQEAALEQYIERMDRLGTAATFRMVKSSANYILKAAHNDPDTNAPRVGGRWVKRFADRTEGVHRIRQKCQELARVVAHDKETVGAWYDGLADVIRQYQIQPADIWNMDEVGFVIGVGRLRWALTKEPKKTAHLPSHTNRESLTVVETVGASGDVLQPFIIIGGVHIMASWFDNDLPDYAAVAMTNSGYIDNVTALVWLAHFHYQTVNQAVGRYRLLIMDNQKCHITLPFKEKCDKYRIIPFTLLPHTTHICQPLDVNIFSPLKHWHEDAIDTACRTGCTNYNKDEFFAALDKVRRQAYKKDTVRGGFRYTGIHPFNPKVVLDKLPAAKETTPPPDAAPEPLTPTPNPLLETPKTYKELQDHKTAYINRTQQALPSVLRLYKAAASFVQSRNLNERDLIEQTAVNKKRRERADNQRRIVVTGGVLLAGEAREIDSARIEAAQARQDAIKKKKMANKLELETAKLKALQANSSCLDAVIAYQSTVDDVEMAGGMVNPFI